MYIYVFFFIIFVIHELEEIFYLPDWIKKNKDIFQRSPILSKFSNISTKKFSLIVFEESLLLLTSYLMFIWNYYYLWIAIFLGFYIHLIGHLIQSLIIRKFFPGMVSCLVFIPSCSFLLYSIISTFSLEWPHVLLLGFLGSILVIVNLLVMHKIVRC